LNVRDASMVRVSNGHVVKVGEEGGADKCVADCVDSSLGQRGSGGCSSNGKGEHGGRAEAKKSHEAHETCLFGALSTLSYVPCAKRTILDHDCFEIEKDKFIW
jgi:hypothetical protein